MSEIMSARYTSTIGIHFGVKYPGNLPQGWELIESPEDWAIGKSPEGQEYFLSPTKAYPRKSDDAHIGKHNPKGIWIDLHSGVIDLC